MYSVSVCIHYKCILELADGDMGIGLNVKNAYMKQKHRMIWERRYGPVGSGMKEQTMKA